MTCCCRCCVSRDCTSAVLLVANTSTVGPDLLSLELLRSVEAVSMVMHAVLCRVVPQLQQITYVDRDTALFADSRAALRWRSCPLPGSCPLGRNMQLSVCLTRLLLLQASHVALVRDAAGAPRSDSTSWLEQLTSASHIYQGGNVCLLQILSSADTTESASGITCICSKVCVSRYELNGS